MDPIERQKAIDVLLKLKRALQFLREPYMALKVTQFALWEIEQLPSTQSKPHYCRECKWSQCHIMDRYGNIETHWYCLNWDDETDEEGYCHKFERRTDEHTN